MVTLVTVGTLLLSAGPPVALWLGMLHRRAHLLVIAILAAFTWCLAIMLASVIWLAIPPLKQVYGWVLFVAVTTQELFRLLLFIAFRTVGRSYSGVQAFIRPGRQNDLLTGISVGVGFSLMSALIHFFSVLADSFADDTAIYTDFCPYNFFVTAASSAMVFSILQILLGVLAWPSYSDPSGIPFVILAYFAHLLMSEITLTNLAIGGCKLGLSLSWGFIAVFLLITVYIARRRINAQIP